ncbi:hypothetical protein BsWGS_00831 [Bradybaena similaris]
MAVPPDKTPVSYLQEYATKHAITTPQYDLITNDGTERVPTFTMRVTVADKAVATGKGSSKQKAKQAAAQNALNILMGVTAIVKEEVNEGPEPIATSGQPKDDDVGNPIGELQELTQKKLLKPPIYEFVTEQGPPHAREFIFTVKLGKFTDKGTGRSKQTAKRVAAANMLTQLKTLSQELNQQLGDSEEDEEIPLGFDKSSYISLKQLKGKSKEAQCCDVKDESIVADKPMPDWSTDGDQGSGELSIAECLKAAVEAELQNQLQDVPTSSQSENEEINPEVASENKEIKPEVASEYVFVESCGLYYHSGTGYYWDPNSGLFFDYSTGTYYQHNETTGEYEVHSQVDVSGQTQLPDSEHQKNSGLFYDDSTGTYYQYNETTGEYEVHSQVDISGQTKLPDSKNQKIKNKRQKRKSRIKEEESNENASSKLKKHIKLSGSLESHNDVVSDEKVDSTSAVIMAKQDNNVDAEDHIEEEFKGDTVLTDETSDSDSESSSSYSQTGSDSESSLESGELTTESSSSDVEMFEIEHPPVAYESTTEMTEEYPPCIRVIVQSSEHLKCGSLYIITCTGGCVGRGKNKGLAIQIDDMNVSKLHAEITFDYEEYCYTLKDKGSQRGTILNGVKLSQKKPESNCCKLHHDDLLQIGSTTFLLHIHKRNETCDNCEPGQVQARIKAASTVKHSYPVMSQEEKKRLQRKELKNIKKKYGLQNSHYEIHGSVYTNPDYTDKAFLRRKLVGSESELPKNNAQPVSVHSPISSLNKGHKLLAKMGWKEGEGLGKTSSGIAEPITVEMRINQNAGLGASTGVSLSLDNVHHAQKAKRWSQARKRYEELKDRNNSHTSVSSNLLTDYDSLEGSHSQLLPVPSKELNSAGSFNPNNCSSSLSSTTFTNESRTISGDQANLLKESEHVNQALEAQSLHITWVQGVTEQIGQIVPTSSSFSGETENT